MKLAVVDDEIQFLNIISEVLLQKYDNREIDVYKNTQQLLDSYINYDLLLLDIELDNCSGIEFARKHYKRFPCIIFVTSYEEYIWEAFNVNVVGYILKKDIDNKLLEKVEQELIKFTKERSHIFITKDSELILREKELISFYYDNKIDCIYMHTLSNIVEICNTSISALEKQLSKSFFKVNRRSIINVNYISKFNIFDKSALMIDEKSEIKVSRRNWKILRQKHAEMRKFYD